MADHPNRPTIHPSNAPITGAVAEITDASSGTNTLKTVAIDIMTDVSRF
ncbi:MAG: hypothetical protein KJP23_05625 [Deltaproteobacteria bacterium]|nr:hypothetical protein [Deltaproteobacteria bacterium]